MPHGYLGVVTSFGVLYRVPSERQHGAHATAWSRRFALHPAGRNANGHDHESAGSSKLRPLSEQSADYPIG